MKIKNLFLLAFLFLFAAACENKSDDPTPPTQTFATLKEYVNNGFTRLEGSNNTVIEFDRTKKTISLRSDNNVDGWGTHTFNYVFDETDGNLMEISENEVLILLVDAGIEPATKSSPKTIIDINKNNPSNYDGKAERYFDFKYELKKP